MREAHLPHSTLNQAGAAGERDGNQTRSKTFALLIAYEKRKYMLLKTQQYLRSHRLLAIFTILILVLLIIGIGLFVIFTARAFAQGQNCGEVHTLNGQFSESGGTVRQTENCFWQAFQQCSAATLTFEASGIDAGVIHTFTTVNNNGKCSISDATQHYIAPNPAQPGKTYSCTGLTQQADGLHFLNCGDEGNIVVPLPLAQHLLHKLA